MALLKDIAAGNIEGMAPTPVAAYAISTYLVNDGLFNMMQFVPNGAGLSGGNFAASYVQYNAEEGVDAAFRGIGEEYTAADATPEPKTVYLKQLGGSYHVDRVTDRALKNGGINVWREQQAAQKANLIKNAFAKYFVSGDTTVTPKGFNGVYKEVFAVNTDLENTFSYDLTGALSDEKALNLEMMFNESIAKMNVNPNAVITTRKGAALARTLNAKRNYGTEVVEIGGLKYNQLMGIPIVEVGDSDFPTNRGALGTPFLFVYIADDEKGIKAGVPVDGNVIDIIEPELGEGTLVKTGAMEMITAPIFQNTRSAAVSYVRQTTAVASLTVTSVAGTASGKTSLSVAPTKIFTGNTYMYKTAATVALPTYDDALTGYNVWDGTAADVTATTGNEIVIVEINELGDVLRAGKTLVVSKA